MLTSPRIAALASALLALLVLGCEDSSPAGDDDVGDDDASDDDVADDDADHACGFAPEPAASFAVTERLPQPGEWIAMITGSVTDAVMPELYSIAVDEGPCRVLSLDMGGCDPPCTYPEICNVDAACEPLPQSIAGGTLTIDGLSIPVEITPEDWNPGYYYEIPETADLFAAGDPVTAELAGEAFPALTLDAHGVATIESPFPGLILELTDGADAQVSWTPGDDPDACVQLILRPQWYGHGQPMPDILWCEAPDSGSLTIPAAGGPPIPPRRPTPPLPPRRGTAAREH